MVPTNIQEWLVGGPWCITRDDFFKVGRDFVDGKVNPSPFTIMNGRGWPSMIDGSFQYEDRTSHEIAHLVCCNDEDIFDPFWGVPEFNFDNGTKDGVLLSTEAARKEIEVVCVQERIDIHCRNYEWEKQKQITPKYMLPLCRNGNTVPPSMTENQFICQCADYALNVRWKNIQSIWDELQRKYALVAKLLA